MTGEDALQLVVELPVQTVAGVNGATVSVVDSEGGHLQTTNSSADLFREMDEHQYKVDDGPCVSALRSGAEQTVAVGQGTYTPFEEVAAQAGVAYVWSLPLVSDGGSSGSLNLYFGNADYQLSYNSGPARALAGIADKALANTAALNRALDSNARLWTALASRGIIGQAQGILMGRENIDPDAAFDILRRASQRTNRTLLDVAKELAANSSTQPHLDADAHGDR